MEQWKPEEPEEVITMAKVALPMILTGILQYSYSMISMFFHSTIGDLPLAGVSLAIAFANITGYSILSGLAMGMQPKAFGAEEHTLLGLFLQRNILFLILTSLPISFSWINMKKIMLIFGEDEEITTNAQTYLLYSLPDLLAQSMLHPLRIYLRSQSITLPITLCTSLSVVLHIPINYFLVTKLGLGIKGAALSCVWTNFILVASFIIYIFKSGVYSKTGVGVISIKNLFKGCKSLLNLSIRSCILFCLEHWRYDGMILVCGLLGNPMASVASMKILIQVTAFIKIFPSSLSSSVSTRVGNELRAGRPGKARLAAIVGLCCSFVLGFFALFLAAGVRNSWPVIFTQDTEILNMTALVLPIVGIYELGNCVRMTGCGAFRGMDRPRIVAYIDLGFYVVGFPVGSVFAFWMGLGFEGLWLGVVVAQMCCVGAMLVKFVQLDSERW